ncbi:MAG TPA: prepilin-type N-terminal cleavage/methylation domain-containing protein [Bacteriovoracaceae bacterium]|nr:prepilin-type N-terminal cleavage/methylation domain-containing protein [Bacteriovoracaceae bacterium]
MRFFKNGGFSLLEIMIAAALMGALALGAINFYAEQQKRLNYWEFQGKREYLRQAIMGQFLNDERNCLCLFSQQPIPAAGGSLTLPLANQDGIGSFMQSNPDLVDCSVKNPAIISTTGEDGVKLISVKLKDITRQGPDDYRGNLEVVIKSTKDVTGQEVKGIRYKVGLASDSSSGTPVFKGCSMNANGSIARQLGSLFNRVQKIEVKGCTRNANPVAQCPSGTRLLSCTTGPGDQHESNESFDFEANYQLNSCKLNIRNNACEDGISSPKAFRIAAYCYPIN